MTEILAMRHLVLPVRPMRQALLLEPGPRMLDLELLV